MQKNCAACKTKNLERKTKSRAGQEASKAAKQAAREAREEAVEEKAHYVGKSLCYYAETSPGVDAATATEEIQVHREWLRAMDQPDVRKGETLRQLAERTFSAWLNQATSWMRTDDKRVPNPPDNFLMSFNRKEQKFNGYHGFNGSKLHGVPFSEIWSPPAGRNGDEVIDVAALPPLPYRKLGRKAREADGISRSWN
jgi:hypothetical protein